MIAIADTSGIIASVDRSCPEHEAARHVMDTAGLLVIPQLVLAELDHLLSGRFNKDAAGQVMDQLIAQARTGRYLLGDANADVLADARLVQRRYRDLSLDLTDSVITVLAREYATDSVLTLDRKDFRAVRPLTPHPAFRILPDDL
ncbi:type II toxin-antitoxin system VapC family toxin [Streptomyces phaeochromogenes]